jgi:UDP-2,3-diacylglucosamine pyrophosphatase LpxH
MAEHSTRHRTLFLSDLHLGSRRCMARALRSFLAHNSAETLVLVGDTFDFWAMRRGDDLPLHHRAALADIAGRAQAGTRVILLPGNHDDTLHALEGLRLDGVTLCPSFVHEAADGRHYLVAHGDHHDPSLQSLWGLARNATFLRERLPKLSRSKATTAALHALWRDLKHWQGKSARFAARLLEESHARGLDGVICGHIHAPEQRQTDKGLYLNCGDWVSHGTAIAEDFSGAFHLLASVKPTPRTRLKTPLLSRPETA